MDTPPEQAARHRSRSSSRWCSASLLGMTTGIADRIFGGPNPEDDRQREPRIDARAEPADRLRRALCVGGHQSSSSALGGLSARADADPARRRALRARSVQAPARGRQLGRVERTRSASACRRSRSPAPTSISMRSQEYGEGGVLSALTNADQQLDQANRARAVADLRKQATAEVPMRLARAGGARRRSSAASRCRCSPPASRTRRSSRASRPKARDEPSYLDLSTPYNQAIEEAERRRAARDRNDRPDRTA